MVLVTHTSLPIFPRLFQVLALHICGMILLVLWDGHLARPLYFGAGKMPTPQKSSLDSATPYLFLIP
ncbi:MAG: hypothetical protein ACYTXY_33530, partial [Nostoc sp.]